MSKYSSTTPSPCIVEESPVTLTINSRIRFVMSWCGQVQTSDEEQVKGTPGGTHSAQAGKQGILAA